MAGYRAVIAPLDRATQYSRDAGEKWEALPYGIPLERGTAAPPEIRLLVPNAPRPSTARRNCEHDETEPNQHHSYEFEGKGVHDNSPR